MTLLILNFQLEISDHIKIRDELKDKKSQYVYIFLSVSLSLSFIWLLIPYTYINIISCFIFYRF